MVVASNSNKYNKESDILIYSNICEICQTYQSWTSENLKIFVFLKSEEFLYRHIRIFKYLLQTVPKDTQTAPLG